MNNQLFYKSREVKIFNVTMEKFFSNLKLAFIDLEDKINIAHSHYKKTNIKKYIIKLSENFAPHIKYISEMDEGIFSSDYNMKSEFLIEKLDLKELFIFASTFEEEVTKKTKKNLFKYLNTIYISSQMALKKLEEYKNVIDKQKTFLSNMMKSLNLDEKLKEKIEQLDKEEDEENNSSGLFGGVNMEKLSELFKSLTDGDNIFGNIMEEVKNEFEKDSFDSENINTKMMSKLKILLKKVIMNIKKKMQSGELSQEKLTEMFNNIFEKTKEAIPGMGDIFDSMKNSMNFEERNNNGNDGNNGNGCNDGNVGNDGNNGNDGNDNNGNDANETYEETKKSILNFAKTMISSCTGSNEYNDIIDKFDDNIKDFNLESLLEEINEEEETE